MPASAKRAELLKLIEKERTKIQERIKSQFENLWPYLTHSTITVYECEYHSGIFVVETFKEFLRQNQLSEVVKDIKIKEHSAWVEMTFQVDLR